jgi:ABC-type glutathione transport system ATPase component
MNENSPVLLVDKVSSGYAKPGLLGKKTVKPVLRDISFTIQRGEIFGLVGASGAGKTTLGRCILGLLDYQGDILIDNDRQERGRRRVLAAKVQGVFQDPGSSLNPVMSAGWLLEEPLRVNGKRSGAQRIRRVDEILDLVGLDPSIKKRRAGELSSGQKQRVCIGCALALDPRLIVADEAVSALDVSVGAQILNLFRELRERLGLALLFISHNIEVVCYLSDRIAEMKDGTAGPAVRAENFNRVV